MMELFEQTETKLCDISWFSDDRNNSYLLRRKTNYLKYQRLPTDLKKKKKKKIVQT